MELPNTLERCYELIQTLSEENATLRKSGDDFGRLAERLNAALQEERRRTASFVGVAGLRSGRGRPPHGLREDNRRGWSAAVGVPVHSSGSSAPSAMSSRVSSPVPGGFKGNL
jgi:hypothetical protein